MNVKITGYDDKGKEVPLDDQSANSLTGNVAKFPITINALIPENGTSFIVSISVMGLECSDCAGGYGADIPTAPCGSINAFDNNGAYIGKKSSLPRWFQSITFRSYQAAIDIPSVDRTSNVPNTCLTCIVSP